MIHNINDKITNLAMERIEEVGRELIIDNEYREISDVISNLYESIKDALPIEHKKLIAIFDEESTNQFNIYLEKMYKQGLKDGIGLCNSINL